MTVLVLKRSNIRPSKDKLNPTIEGDGALTQVCFVPNSCCFHRNRFPPRCLLMICYVTKTSYYTLFILHSNLVKSGYFKFWHLVKICSHWLW